MIRFPAAALVAALLAGCQITPPPQQSTSEEASPSQVTQPDKTPEASLNKHENTQAPVKQVTIHEKVIHVPKHIDGRLLLGVEEKAFLPNYNLSLEAKIDTGAAKTSIDARDYQLFERDGKRWVKFTLHRTNKGDVPMEFPVKELTRIKRPGEEALLRPVISMTIRISNLTQQVDVTLNDREEFSFPLLIGRNFIRDLAVVDVNQRDIAETKVIKEHRLKAAAPQNAKQDTIRREIKKTVNTEGLSTLGAVEHVTLSDTGTILKARIDTGATTSSLDARNISFFEKGGKDWVKFEIPTDSEKLIPVEYPVTRFVHIKRHGADFDRRPVIKLQVRIGKIDIPTEFTLRDRDTYEFPVLIGVQFLKQSAIVDVSKEYIGDRVIKANKG